MNTDFDQDLLQETLGGARASSGLAGGDSSFVAAGAEPLRMRCPNCKKLYSVSLSSLGAETLSRFECVDCTTSFFAMRPELNGAYFLETHELETQFAPLNFSLPHLPDFTDESFEREVELERVVRSAVVEVPALPIDREREAMIARDVELSENGELVMMWQTLQDDYHDLTRHEKFIAACIASKRLQFAAHKYAQILAVAPQENIARAMRARVIGLASYGFDAADSGMGWQTWTFPLPSFNSFIILLGTILVAVGLGVPNMHQTAGLGFAMIALAIGLRVFLRRPRT